jgi:EmrB/QacA subfamily drug resistance transporter
VVDLVMPVATSGRPGPPSPDPAVRRRELGARLAVGLSGVVVAANLSMMSVAFPALERSFPDASRSALSWVLTTYTIVFGAALVPAGRLADRLGRRRVFMVGLAIFATGSAIAAAAPVLGVLVAARALQGVGAACSVPSSLGLLIDASPPGRRASASAFYSLVASLGGVAGPTIGALLIEGPGWRSAFVLGPAFALPAWLAGRRCLPTTERNRGAGIPDVLGSALVVVALSSLSLGIVQGGRWGWDDPRVVGAFAVAPVLGAAFVWRSAHHPRPVLPLELLRLRSFAMANLASLAYGMTTGALLTANVLFLRDVWGYSLVASGLGLLPLSMSAAAMSVVAGRLGNRFGERAVGVPGVLAIALALLALRLTAGTDAEFATVWLPVGIVTGSGMAFGYPMIQSACVRDVGSSQLSVASATNRMTLQIGNAIGIAVVIAILGTADGADALDRYRLAWSVLAAVGVVCAALLAAVGGPGVRAPRVIARS